MMGRPFPTNSEAVQRRARKLLQDARQKQFASGRRYKAPTPTQIANEVKRCKADRSVVMVLLGHLPIWTPSAYSETVTPAGYDDMANRPSRWHPDDHGRRAHRHRP